MQIELYHLAPNDPRRPAMVERERALLDRCDARWRASLPTLRGLRWGDWRRGLIASAEADNLSAFARGARVLFAIQPVREVRVLALRKPNLLTTTEGLRRLTALDLSSHALPNDGAISCLARSPFVGRLATLNLSRNILRGRALRALASSRRLSGLTCLRLAHCGVRAASLRQMVELAGMRRIRELDLSFNSFGDAGAHILAEASTLDGLTALNVEGSLDGTGHGPEVELLRRRFPFVRTYPFSGANAQ